MKIVVLEFADTVDVSDLAMGATPTLTIGTTNITGGSVVTAFQVANPPAPTLLAHFHTIPSQAGNVNIPSGSTGPVEPTP